MTDFMKSFLSLNQVGLGRLVALSSDADTPSRNYCEKTEISNPETYRRPYSENDTTLNSTSSTTLRSAISQAVTFLFGKEKKSKSHMAFAEGYTYELHNVVDHFNDLLVSEKVQPWLDRYQKTHKICMIVAFSTAVAASVELDTQSSTTGGAKGTVPIAEALAPGASQLPVGKATDLTAELEHNRGLEAKSKFKAPEERVILVCYQQVKFKSFFNKTTAPPYSLASKGIWKALDGSRGKAGDEWIKAEIIKDAQMYERGTVNNSDTFYLIHPEDSDDESDESDDM